MMIDDLRFPVKSRVSLFSASHPLEFRFFRLRVLDLVNEIAGASDTLVVVWSVS